MKDVFIVNMANKEVRQKLSTEPKPTVNETIQFAIAYEEGSIRQQSFDKLERPNMKTEAIGRNNINQLQKDGAPQGNSSVVKTFTPQHLKECRSIGVTYMKCGKVTS